MNGRSFTKRDLKAGSLNRVSARDGVTSAPQETPGNPALEGPAWQAVSEHCPPGFLRDSLGVLVPKHHVTSEADWRGMLPARSEST